MKQCKMCKVNKYRTKINGKFLDSMNNQWLGRVCPDCKHLVVSKYNFKSRAKKSNTYQYLKSINVCKQCRKTFLVVNTNYKFCSTNCRTEWYKHNY